MALSRVKVWTSGETLTASDLNAEFNSIINNASSLISPLSGSLDWDGYAHTLDAAGVTTAQSTTAVGWAFTPGSKVGSPSATGGTSNWAAHTFTDSATAGSGTATLWTGHSFQRPTLAASNASVTTTNAATMYIANAPLAGSNQTLTNAWALWVDDGAVRFDGAMTVAGALTASSTVSGTPAGQMCPAGYLWGLTMTNGTDATNDIDIAVGECASNDATSTDRVRMALTSALTKQLDAAWAVGSAAGGLDTGAIANTTYHVYIIQRPDTGVVDALFSTSASAPTMPTNYTKKRRIGSILREGGAIVGFIQDGNRFARKVATLDVDATNPGTSAVTRTLKVPVGINVVAHVNCAIVGGNGFSWGELISSMDMTDAAPSLTAAPLVNVRGFVDAGGGAGAAPIDVRTDTSAQVRSRSVASDASYIVRVATMGWTDTRGMVN